MTPEPVWVDLGLPSGLKWRNADLGANVPTGSGLYFSWGNLQGVPRGGVGDFTQEAYNETPAASIDSNLTLEEDAARVILGSPWRMPTRAEFAELLANCSKLWTVINGVQGFLLTSNINGNTLFFVAGGSFNGVSVASVGDSGNYWSSDINTPLNAFAMHFNANSMSSDFSIDRYRGFNIRPVCET